MMIEWLQQVADHVGGEVRGQGRHERGAGQRRVHHVVLGGLVADLLEHLLHAVRNSGSLSFLRLMFAPSSRSYAAMPYSKKQALTKFHSGWTRKNGCHGWSSSTRMMP